MNNFDLEKLKERAVEVAIQGNYQEAIRINTEILEHNPQDVDSLMQLAHAYWQIGDLHKAKDYYKRTLEIEPNNNLARKRLALLNSVTKKHPGPLERKKGRIVPITDLIEEPGKTKIVRLGNIGKPEHISLLSIGEEVFLNIRKRKIEIRDTGGNFIGYLPDDISKRLTEFINHGGKYEAFVFSIDKNEIKVFVREIKKASRYRKVSSFIYEDIIPRLEDEEDEEETPDKDLEDDEDAILTPDEIIEDDDEDEEEDDEEEDRYNEYEE